MTSITSGASGNTLLRNNDNTDTEPAQNPCYFGLFISNPPEDSHNMMLESENQDPNTRMMVKCHLISIQPIPAKIGYTEWVDTVSFLTFRSILLQQQPTACTLYTTHDLTGKFSLNNAFIDTQASAKLLDSVENELTLAGCPVDREPLYIDSVKSSNLSTILRYHFTPTAISSDSTSMNDDTTNDDVSKHDKTTVKARSIYPDEQITTGYQLCRALVNNNCPQFPNSGPIATGLYTQMLKKYIITPLRELQQQETQLASLSGHLNRSKLAKLTKNSLQLPMKYLFYYIQVTTKLRIDQNTLNSIGVFPSPTESSKATTSLFGLLNTCQTTFGSRLLQQWLKQPLLDIYELNQRHLAIGGLVQSSDVLGKLRTSMRGIADVEKILAKLNKYYTQTDNCTNSTRVTSVMSSDIIKELLSLFAFVVKMKSILTHLASLDIPIDPNNNDINDENENQLPLVDEDQFYNIFTEKVFLPDDNGEEKEHVITTQTLKHDVLLLQSVNMNPKQFVTIKYTREMYRLLSTLEQFQNLIQTTIDLDAVANHEYLIKADITPDLAEISKRKDKIHRALNRLHLEAVSHLRTDTNRVKMAHTSANDIGFHLRVTRKDEKLIREESSTYQVLETRKDGVRFTTNNFRKLSSQYQEEISKYHLAQAETSLQILDAAMTYCADFTQLMTMVAELDVLASLANLTVSSTRKYVRPQLISTTGITIGPNVVDINNEITSNNNNNNDKNSSMSDSTTSPTTTTPTNSKKPIAGHVILNNARHPTIEAQPNLVFIPNDVYLKHGETQLQLITGPNMGGKSCYLRMAALIVLMAQIGSYVPCDSASICLVDCILARVGAGDMQLKGVSTFMKEMLETCEILTHGTANSLIVVDELGRGTSTYDGFGLAWGIAEYLATRVNSYTLFATHFHEMTAMSEQFKTVSNKHVTALTGEDSITMLYKVKDGHCDRSFGIHVAQMTNFPREIIHAARQKANALEAYAHQNLLQLNLPIKYGDEIVHNNTYLSEERILAMDNNDDNGENNKNTKMIERVNGQKNSFAIATTQFDEDKSFDILSNIFSNEEFGKLLDTHSIINSDDLTNAPRNSEFQQAISDVYNTTVSSLRGQ